MEAIVDAQGRRTPPAPGPLTVEVRAPAAGTVVGVELAERLGHLDVRTPDGHPFPLLETMQRVVDGEAMQGVLAVRNNFV